MIAKNYLKMRKKNTSVIKKIKKQVRNKYLACAFTDKLNNEHHGKLKEELENDYLQGRNNYPKTLSASCKLANDYTKCRMNQLKLVMTMQHLLITVKCAKMQGVLGVERLVMSLRTVKGS